MRQFIEQRGFITFAQNGRHDYLRMAYGLALSLRATQREVTQLSVVVTPGTEVPDRYRQVFDQVIEVPWLDEAAHSEWKLENEWKVYHITPYMHTIKLDADMLFTSDIGEWWPLLERQDIMACSTVETYRGDVITSDYYRQCFTANDLPNLYTACMFFRVCDFAQELFDTTEMIFHNWQRFFATFLAPFGRPQYFSTDVAFALAAKLVGAADCLSSLPVPRFVHMKPRLQGWPDKLGEDDDWRKHVPVTLTDDLTLKIGRYRQHLPVHYQIKDFLTDAMIETYERAL